MARLRLTRPRLRTFIPLATLFFVMLFPACSGGGTSPEPSPTAEPTVSQISAALTTATTQRAQPTATSTAPPEPTSIPSPTGTAPPSPTPTNTATPTPLPPTPTPTATSTPTPTPIPPTPTVTEGSVAIIDLVYDPAEGRDSDGESVYIQNLGESAADMSGWVLVDIAEHTYIFPNFVLQPGAIVQVHICAGENTAEILFWGHCSAVWNNDGDTAYLKDATGRLISEYAY